MALAVGRAGRQRSSTSASRGLTPDEQNSTAAELIQKLAFESEPPATDEIVAVSEVADELRSLLLSDGVTKDTFRRGHGFEAIPQLFADVKNPAESIASDDSADALGSLMRNLLLLLLAALKDHSGNQKYFTSHLNGWRSLAESFNACCNGLLEKVDADNSRPIVATVLRGLLALAVADEHVVSDISLEDHDAESTKGPHISKDCTMHNPEACLVAIRLAVNLLTRDHSSTTAGWANLAGRVLSVVFAMTKSSIRNAVTLWQTEALSILLPAMFENGVQEDVKLVLDNLTSSLADFGLGSMDDTAYVFKQARSSQRAGELLLRMLHTSKQPAFIHFDLTQHGYCSLELPSLPRAFPATGYTFTAWVRIDEYDPSCHTTLFGAFDTSQTCFILAYLEKDSHQLILQTSIRSARPSVRFKSTRFEAGRWYHVAIVHRKAPADFRQSPAVLFVDGEFAEQVKCAFPESPPELEEKRGDTNSPAPTGARRVRPIQTFFGTPSDLAMRTGRSQVHSKWSLASAHLYQVPLTDEFLAVHYRLGPRYAGNLQDCLGPLLTYRASAELNRYNELLHPDKSEKSDIVTATEGHGSEVVPETRLLVSISPSAIISQNGTYAGLQGTKYELDCKALPRYQQMAQKAHTIVINAAIPNINEAVTRSYGTGVLTGDPAVAIPKALDDASWCLTGTLPVLVRLVESATTKPAFLRSVQIYFECIKDNWRISEAMEKGNGFGMLAVIIREKLGIDLGSTTASRKASAMLSLEDRQSVPLELLLIVLDFVGYNKVKPEDSMIVNPMAYRVLLLDFDTWRRCDLATQTLYFTQFVSFVTHNRHQAFNQKRLTRMRVVKKLIDAMKSEDIHENAVPSLMTCLLALLDSSAAQTLYKDLAMFIAYGLQDERAAALKPMRSMASMVHLRQRAASWARTVRGSRPSTPGGAQSPLHRPIAARSELAIRVLELFAELVCSDQTSQAARRFHRAVPNRWLLHLLAENDVRVTSLALRIICRLLVVLGNDFKTPFVDKNGGFVTLRSRLKSLWRSPSIWLATFAMLFGQHAPTLAEKQALSLFSLIQAFNVDDALQVVNPEMLPTIMTMLETGLRSVTRDQEPNESETSILKAVIQFFSELYSRSGGFRDFAGSSRYMQELLFVLYPVLVGSDRLSAETELQAEQNNLSFLGEEVKMRPHSNSMGGRPPSVRSLDMGPDQRTPSPRVSTRIQGPKRLSSFVFVKPGDSNDTKPAQFTSALAPKNAEPLKINAGNAVVESLLEVAMTLFVDLICNKTNFQGIGLFLKVPPGFREHQAYFESYVIVNTLSHLWNHLKLNQNLLVQSKVLTNLSRYCQHMAEAVFEGWFIDGAQPVLDFAGNVLEYLQQPEIAALNNVKICSYYTGNIRVVFLRVTLWRLSELDESVDEEGAVAFLNKMNYWQTILFSTENQETLFIRLICFILYMKLVSDARPVQLAAVSLWRTVLVHKPTESATLLSYANSGDQRHLATGFMKLVSMDDDDFIAWIDENRKDLDSMFVDALNKSWSDFVAEENKRNEESAKSRLNKRKEKLRQWQIEEANVDDILHRYEVSTSHWRSNVHSQERLKLQRAVQDHQENVNHLMTVFTKLEKLMQQPSSIEAPTSFSRWKLDETEAANRMRLRIIPDTDERKDSLQPKRKAGDRLSNGKLVINTQIPRIVSGNILSSFPGSPTPINADGTDERPTSDRPRADSASDSQLLEGAFEVVEDPKEDEDGVIEDKNRKIMTSLQRGDMVQQLYNISRIVGLEACEGLLVVGKKSLYLQDNFFQRSDGEIVSSSQAPDDERDPYVQLISGKDVGSQRTKHSVGDQETRHWTWSEVLSISKRRFLFRDVSVEVFFTDGRSYLITCTSTKIRDDLFNAIVSRAPHVHSSSGVASEDAWRLDTLRNPEEAPQSFSSKFANVFNQGPTHAATKRWARGEMSNFQYLMLLNTMAGRTFNDVTQYPVFPWVLADYSSAELDLHDPKSFRDFSKPMGCQTPVREAEYKDRFKQFAEMADQNAPPFHYGTHYSSAMIVSSYLIRLQPFVQSYLLLQGGNFDHADRLFDSIEKAWLSASKDTMSDVRELTPEFFYLPDFLVNINKYDFGVKQGEGGKVDGVHLPAWAKGDPQIFIAKHREALESPYVSEHLHQWVDLVFGCKQRGDLAVEATNVFQHLSYQGAKDLDTITDPVERLATIGIIHSFGQTPYQVFQRPHPAREASRSSMARLDTLAESLIRLPDPLFDSDEKVATLVFSPTVERLLCAGPYRLNLMPNCDRFAQWGYADHSLRFFSSNTKRLLGLYENTHIGPISTATLADSRTLVTAGNDCTVAVWSIAVTRDLVDLQPKSYLFGHRTPVDILSASRVFSTLLSASTDGHVLLWGLNKLNCIRSLLPAGGLPIQAAKISNVSGHIVLCQGAHVLLYTLNGHLLVKQKICESDQDDMACCSFYEAAGNEWVERELIFTGHPRGVANVWALTTLSDGAWHLQLVRRLNHVDASREDGGNTSAAVTAILPMASAVYTGDENGRVWEWDCIQRQASISVRGR